MLIKLTKNLKIETMNENSYFDINRIKFLLSRQLRFSTQTLLIGFGAVAGLIIFILTLTVIFDNAPVNNELFYGLIMPFVFAGGYIFTSTIFSELRTSHRGYLYLTLPASTLEKLFVSWFITSVLYSLAAMLIMFSINLILMAVSVIFSAPPVPVFNLFEPYVLKMYAIYMVTQPVFILGAIYFRRVNFLKTLLALFVIGFVISVYTTTAANLIVFHGFNSFEFNNHDMPGSVQDFFENTFAPVITALFWYCLAPFFLIVSYFRLKERQV
jgi:hypothetical protein